MLFWLAVLCAIVLFTFSSEGKLPWRRQRQQQPQQQQQRRQHQQQQQQQRPVGDFLRNWFIPFPRNDETVVRRSSPPQVSHLAVTSGGAKSPNGSVSSATKPPLFPSGFRLSNLTNFSFIINNDVCGPDPVDLVMVVVSDTRRPSWRAAVRDVLPSAVLAELQIRRVFLLAELAPPTNTSAQYDRREAALLAENHEHADLVVGSFRDSYHNLTYKHLMGLHWASAYCPQAHHIVKMDQDVAVDVFRLHRLLQTAPRNLTIIGTLWPLGPVIRDPTSKWFVSRQEYAPDKYPAYMSGSIYVITHDVAARLAAGSITVPFFWIDDVFVTGVLRARVASSVKMLDFTRLWGRPDNTSRRATIFTKQLACLVRVCRLAGGPCGAVRHAVR